MLNKYTGSIFILGTGPSLAQSGVPVGAMTFACSHYFRWKEGPMPSFYVVNEERHCAEWQERGFDGARASVAKFVLDWQPARAGWIGLPAHHYRYLVHRDGLGEYPMTHNGHGGPVAAIQIARWLGFDRFYLLGCDATKEGHVYDKATRTVGFSQMAEEWAAVSRALPGQVMDCTPGGQLSARGILSYVPLEDALV